MSKDEVVARVRELEAEVVGVNENVRRTESVWRGWVHGELRSWLGSQLDLSPEACAEIGSKFVKSPIWTEGLSRVASLWKAEKSLDKAVVERSRAQDRVEKLASLSRELQHQLRNERSQRSELAAKFQSSFRDISARLDEQEKQYTQMRDENQALREKLKILTANSSTRDEMIAALKSHNELLGKERSQFSNQLTEQDKKFSEFEDVIKRSSESFNHMKEQLDELRSHSTRMETEKDEVIVQFNDLQRTLRDSLEREKSAYERGMKLESLCRVIQKERDVCRNELRRLKSGKKISAKNKEKKVDSKEENVSIGEDVIKTEEENSKLSTSEEEKPKDVANSHESVSEEGNVSHVEEMTEEENSKLSTSEEEKPKVVANSHESVSEEGNVSHVEEMTEEENSKLSTSEEEKPKDVANSHESVSEEGNVSHVEEMTEENSKLSTSEEEKPKDVANSHENDHSNEEQEVDAKEESCNNGKEDDSVEVVYNG